MPVFRIRQGLKAGQKIECQTRQITIGRSPHNTVILPDESVDLAHASLEHRGDCWILQDLGAFSGTRLNDDLVNKPCRVFDGDVIMLGKIRVEIQGVGRLNEIFGPVSAGTMIGPKTIEAVSRKRLYRVVQIGGLASVVLLIVLFLLGKALFQASPPGRRNEPPVLDLLLTEREIITLPQEKVIFFTEAADQEDLDRVEFWVNDVLQAVKEPMDANVIKMKTRHQWSTDQPETYTLSVIAYDKIGQSSEMIKILVKVQEP